jgi:hypothetical protein
VRESREELLHELREKQKKLTDKNFEVRNTEILKDIEDVRQSLVRMKQAEERLYHELERQRQNKLLKKL